MGVLALLLNADLNFSPGVRQLRCSIPSRGRRRGHCSSHVHSFFPAGTGGRLLKESDTSLPTPPNPHQPLGLPGAQTPPSAPRRPSDGQRLVGRSGPSTEEGKLFSSQTSTKDAKINSEKPGTYPALKEAHPLWGAARSGSLCNRSQGPASLLWTHKNCHGSGARNHPDLRSHFRSEPQKHMNSLKKKKERKV